MPNLLSLLNERIRRVARREIRAQTRKTRRLTAQHRRDIAALKRQVAVLARTVAFLEKQEQRRVASPPRYRKRPKRYGSAREASGPSAPVSAFRPRASAGSWACGPDDLLLGIRQVAAEEETVAGPSSGSSPGQARGAATS